MAASPIPFMDLTPQNTPLADDLEAALRRVIDSGQFTLGPEVEAFESAFAEYCGTQHAVAVNNGTAALHVGLLALGVGPGDEVITVAQTFIATVEAILYCGAKPIYVDVHPRTLVMDVRTVEAAITEHTRAIVPVHLYGNPVDMTALRAVADAHGIPILEDAAQAHGARHRGARVGSLGRAAAFSFYPTKNLGAIGEGGMVTTDDGAVAATCRSLRQHGQTGEYYHTLLGYNYRMTAFQGAVLGVKLPHLDAWNDQRRELAARYDTALEDSGALLLEPTPDSEPVYHLYVVLVTERERVQKELQERGIATRVHYPTALFDQPSVVSHKGGKQDRLPVTRSAASQVLSLPFYPGMPAEHVDRVSEALWEILG